MNYAHAAMDARLEVRHLRLVAAIAEEGSVTEAGKRLHLTQSALSHQLRDAEEKLGASLFLRLGKKMVLTPAGDKLLTCALRVLHELQNAEMEIAGLNGGTRGVVRLCTGCYTCYHWLPALLKTFHKKYSKVEVSIEAEATRRPAEALLEGKLDIAIMVFPPQNKAFRLTPMFKDELVLVMSPSHRLAALEHVSPCDLAEETVLIYPPREESTLLQEVLRPAGVKPKRVIEAPLTEAIIEMAAADTGIGFLARWAIAPHLESGRLAARPVSSRGFHRHWYAVTLKDQRVPAYLEAFLNLLANSTPKHARVYA